MLTSVLRKLKQLISPRTSPKAESWSEGISEQREESDRKMQNAELGMQNFDTEGEQIPEVENEYEAEAEKITEVEKEYEAEAENEQTPAPRGNLSHLSSSVPRAASLPKGAMTKAEMREMREILGNIDDAELHRLYKRVTN